MEWNRVRMMSLLLFTAGPVVGMAAETGPSPGGPEALAQGPTVICIPGTDASPGSMTELGFPCPAGTEPSSTLPSGSSLLGGPDGSGNIPGLAEPGWSQEPRGASGVSGSERTESMGGMTKDDESSVSSPAAGTGR